MDCVDLLLVYKEDMDKGSLGKYINLSIKNILLEEIEKWKINN